MTEARMVTLPAGAFRIVEAGRAGDPLVILLHGFPETADAWGGVAPGLAAGTGRHVVALDQRGYNLGPKPRGVASYRLDALAGDVLALADHLGAARFALVGHDWGASVTWWTATRHPQRVERFAILNAPHPAVWRRAMREDPEQRRRSAYVQPLRIPVLPELLVRLGGYSALASAFDSAVPPGLPAETLAAYKAAWARPGALTGMLNWYRALFAGDLAVPAPGSILPPALALWGEQDPFAAPSLADHSLALCADARIERFPRAGHWIVHDETEAVLASLTGFIRAGSAG